MSAVEISPGAAEARAVGLLRRARRHVAAVETLRAELNRLGFGDHPALRLAVGNIDAAGLGLSAAARRIADLARSAVAADHFGNCTGTSSANGDPGETYTCARRPAWQPDDLTNRGLGILTRALADTADDSIIGNDEFEIVHVADDRYLLVLAGVTDLGRPDLGYDERSRTVRDLDQGAVSSATGPDIDDNEYALYVREAVRRYIPDGARIAIVGHSYGADTGLDLAADSTFNGQLYTVTHVAAFGYHIKHQIGAVPQRTEVLAVNNTTDAVVVAESIVDGPHRFAHGHAELRRSLLDRSFGDARSALGDIGSGLVELAHDAITSPAAVSAAAHRTTTVASDGTHHRVGFAGGIGRDAGHGQRRYIELLNTGDIAAVSAFGNSLTDHGYGPTNTEMAAIAVDISHLD